MNLSTLNIVQFLESSKIQIPNGFKSIKGVLDLDFYDLVKSIGESTSREDELYIVNNEIKKLKQTFSKDVTKEKIRECLIRMIYCHMLGYEVPFGYIQALNMTQDSNILNKRTGYLALSLCLPEKHELLIMAVNSILKGLNSANYLEVCSALTAMTKLVDRDTIPAFMQKILQLLNHQKSIVRKKAVNVLHRFYKLVGRSFLEDDQVHDKLRQSLCDRDPSVMAASICIFLDISNNTENIPILIDLVPSFVGILKQVAEGRLPNTFIYHGIHHPWLQINLLKLLANLGINDVDSSNHMYQVLLFTMQQAQKFKNNVGFAILYQTIKTLTSIHPNIQLIEQCSKNLSILLKSRHNNLKYFGIKALTSIVKVSPKLVLPYQVEVIESLESSDETLKRKSFDLLYRMTNQSNIVPVCSKLIEQLVLSNDQNFKSELVNQITHLAEKYSPNDIWYIDTISTILSIPNSISINDDQQFAYNLIKLVSEEDDIKIKHHIAEIFLNNLLNNQQQHHQQQQQSNNQQLNIQQYSDIYIKIMSWVISEYSNLVVSNNSVIENTIIDYLCDLLEKDYQGETKSWIIMCIGKLAAQLGGKSTPQLEILTRKFNTSKSLISQQRSFELQEILKDQKLINQILPLDAYCEDIDFDQVFKNLNSYANKSIEKGGKKYKPYEKRKNTPLVDIPNEISGTAEKGLNFEYPPPPNPFNLYNQTPIQNQRQIQYHQNNPQQQQSQQLLLMNNEQQQQFVHEQNQMSLVPISNQQQQQIQPYQTQNPQTHPNNQSMPSEQPHTKLGLPKPNKVLWTKQGFVGSKSQAPPASASQHQQPQQQNQQNQQNQQHQQYQQHQQQQQQIKNTSVDPEKEKLAQQLFDSFANKLSKSNKKESTTKKQNQNTLNNSCMSINNITNNNYTNGNNNCISKIINPPISTATTTSSFNANYNNNNNNNVINNNNSVSNNNTSIYSTSETQNITISTSRRKSLTHQNQLIIPKPNPCIS
ncbi:hypothetical protein DICPUDRAFT_55169 [Dictyostelium purpureum]|uniref:Clathrin/coatomer adaptor adaptin-like N-terminal domain-containing protein n=1 Tax=Dictyostelium purpureum TaxID=5786 RepID=F0ZKQ3_DICPU|nr:uncharacterized protein DICPUDRAFT_55169 [Dictyostelium purpureum]EGC35468.1 hypothetical protein DICPUDRAFT_55169 [Dictyostelium purpureum]|eukprot:XP_003288011.1 hypothetical protein DICPUDRAFT_55169 [Dictyostelium purpureum]